MDKFEFKLKAKQLNKLANAKDYKTAMEVLETMDWSRSKDVGFLLGAADIYETNGRYDEAIDVLLRAYEFSGNGRLITYKLTNLAIKAGNKEEAAAYYEEFVNVAPRDMERYALQYQVAKLNGEPAEKLIEILEKQREVDLDEEWSYELAELYHQAGRGEECVELCDEIMLYYALGHYVEKAGALKQLYQSLTPEQAELFDNPEKFEENLRRTQEEFRYEEPIPAEPEPVEEETSVTEETPLVINLTEEEPKEDHEEDDSVEELPEEFDFAALVQPLDVIEETEDDLYFTEDEEEEPEEEEIPLEEPEEIVPIFEEEPVLYVDDEEETWMAEDVPEEIHWEEDVPEEEFEEEQPDEFVEEEPVEMPAMEETFEELPEIIPPFAVAVEAEPEEVTLAWGAVPEPAEEEEIRKIFAQETEDFYEEDAEDDFREETWEAEQERMLEEAEQKVLEALEEDENEVLYAEEEDFVDESEEEPEEIEELQEEKAEEEFAEESPEEPEEEIPVETPEEDFPMNLTDELEKMVEETEEETGEEESQEAIVEEPEEDSFEDSDEDEDFFEDPEEEEDFFEEPEEEDAEEPKDVMPKKTHHILVRTDYPDEGMKMAIEALKRLPDEVRPKAIAKTSGDKLNRKGIRGSYEQLQNKILIVQGAGALEKEVLGDIRQFIMDPENHCIAVLIDSSEKIGEVCMRDPALAALFTTDYEYYEYSPDELVAHGVDYAAEKGYTFDEMAMLALYAGVEDIISEADGSQWIQTEELVDYAIRKAEKKGFFSRGPKVGKDGKKILKEDHLF